MTVQIDVAYVEGLVDECNSRGVLALLLYIALFGSVGEEANRSDISGVYDTALLFRRGRVNFLLKLWCW